MLKFNVIYFNQKLSQLKIKQTLKNKVKSKTKKLIILNKKNLKKKVFFNLITELNSEKYLIINNLNNFNLNSKKIDLELNAKLINTSQSRIVNLPLSGITKLVKFTNLIDLKNKINLLLSNKLNFKIICIKINNKFFLFNKIFNNLILKKLTKKEFVKNTLIITFLKLTNFFKFNFLNLVFFNFKILNFHLINLKKKEKKT